MSLTQLDPRSKGPSWAHFVIDYRQESALLWVVFMDAGRILEVRPTQQFFAQPQTDRARTFLGQLHRA